MERWTHEVDQLTWKYFCLCTPAKNTNNYYMIAQLRIITQPGNILHHFLGCCAMLQLHYDCRGSSYLNTTHSSAMPCSTNDYYYIYVTTMIRPLQINSLFLIPLSPKTDAGGRLEMVVHPQVWWQMVIKTISSAVQKIEAVYFCIVLVLKETHAGGNQGGMRNN